jgi:small subunit ribosomal protein S33
VLRQRLRGPALAAYYPRKTATLEDLRRAFKKHDFQIINEKEDDRLENITIAKMRGKGAPKKKKEKDSEFSPGGMRTQC